MGRATKQPVIGGGIDDAPCIVCGEMIDRPDPETSSRGAICLDCYTLAGARNRRRAAASELGKSPHGRKPFGGDELISETAKLRRLLFHVLHQRTGPLGQKVEDILLRENEPLLLEILNHTRNL